MALRCILIFLFTVLGCRTGRLEENHVLYLHGKIIEIQGIYVGMAAKPDVIIGRILGYLQAVEPEKHSEIFENERVTAILAIIPFLPFWAAA